MDLQLTVQDGSDEDDLSPLKFEAMDWASRFAIGPVTDADLDAFEHWRARSPAHHEAYGVARDFLGELRALDLPPALPTLREANDNAPARGGRISRRGFLGGGAVAASVAAAGVIAAQSPLGLWPTLAELLADERTGAGERRRLTPMAGVAIEMNARTALSRLGDGVRLVSGEIFVTVDRPHADYRVAMGDATLAARRASFNVDTLDDGLCVTCVEGAVSAAKGGRSVRLAAGDAVTWKSDGSVTRTVADAGAITAWRRGLLMFNGTPLATAVAQINRYFPGRLILRGEALGARPVTGTFHVEQIELAVVQITQLTHVSATRLPGGVVLLG